MKSAKICIIGGGIAGLTSAIFLKRAGFEVNIYEQAPNLGQGGFAFLLLANGLDVLKQAGLIDQIYKEGDIVNKLILNDETNKTLDIKTLSDAVCIRRTILCSILSKNISADLIESGHQFTKFIRDKNGFATHACFKNGHAVEADIFIGADGTRSLVRSEIDPSYQVPPVEIRELVSYVEIEPPLKNSLVKFQHRNGSLAAGYVPINNHTNWYMQFDAKYWDLDQTKDKKRFAKEMIGYFPDPIPKFIELTDFSTSHLWSTTNMHVLPKFYDKNILIIGDAAHTFSPFSSQGVNAALEDACLFAQVLSTNTNLEDTMAAYTEARKPSINFFMSAGKEMIKTFLRKDGNSFIPLVS